jgi:hypothetical protein
MLIDWGSKGRRFESIHRDGINKFDHYTANLTMGMGIVTPRGR